MIDDVDEQLLTEYFSVGRRLHSDIVDLCNAELAKMKATGTVNRAQILVALLNATESTLKASGNHKVFTELRETVNASLSLIYDYALLKIKTPKTEALQ